MIGALKDELQLKLDDGWMGGVVKKVVLEQLLHMLPPHTHQ